MTTTSVKEWAFTKMFNFVRAGAKLVKKEQYQARIDICKKCPRFGIVEPIDGIKLEGCTECGCPAITKPKIYSMPREKK